MLEPLDRDSGSHVPLSRSLQLPCSLSGVRSREYDLVCRTRSVLMQSSSSIQHKAFPGFSTQCVKKELAQPRLPQAVCSLAVNLGMSQLHLQVLKLCHAFSLAVFSFWKLPHICITRSLQQSPKGFIIFCECS